MLKCPALLIAALVLQPGMAIACKLENATLRPKYSAEHFEIRSSSVGGNPIFDLTVRRTGEIEHVSFLELGRAFVDFRMRTRRSVEHYTFPRSGLWSLVECRVS